ncbi:putative peptide maturation dehydrogenase [Dokdonella soli]|uniref:Peptide maturation dehydrogenase n=2 Tax=Dokdonella soli TaxID=529810 RepID=A0ABN1IFB8_9GAMM
MIEPREQLTLDLAGLFAGGNVLAANIEWIALAPHLDAEIKIDASELTALGTMGETSWTSIGLLAQRVASAVIESLLRKGLLIGDGPHHMGIRERDEAVRAGHWRPLSAVAHYFSRWSDAGSGEDVHVTRHRTLTDLVREHGAPPSHLTERVEKDQRQTLSQPRRSALDTLFRRRATCRNFDTGSLLGEADFSDLLHRVLGCHDVVEVIPGAMGLKKSNPSGGGLHPLEAYLLVRGVEGFASGLYHYHVAEHALEPLTPLDADAAYELANRFVAGQDFFSNAHVLVVLTARFRRTFWKYRNHPKAYRAIVLEAGHVSQNLYLAATELGLGAYVTAAINEIDIEKALGLDPLQESPIVVCGFGPRADRRTMLEFDPLGTVWDENGRRR